jgi:hypothetical protein
MNEIIAGGLIGYALGNGVFYFALWLIRKNKSRLEKSDD